MSNYSENDSGDYVLVHKSKAKISRARKMVIGVMAIGAVAALTGAGTFASFTASTTNDATFKTGTLILSNKVASGNTCFSSKVDNVGPTNDSDLDINDTPCDALFAANLLPSVSNNNLYTALITVRNEGTSTGSLTAFAPAVCANSAGTTATNEVQRISIGGATAGTFTVSFTNELSVAGTSGTIAFDALASTARTTLEATTSIGTGNVTVTKDGTDFLIAFIGLRGGANQGAVTIGTDTTDGGGVTVAPVADGGGTIPAGTGAGHLNGTTTGPCGRVKMQVQETSNAAGTAVTGTCFYPNSGGSCANSYGALKDFYAFGAPNSTVGTMAAGETKFFRVRIQLPTGTSAPTGICDQAGSFEYATTTGVGCDNYLMNTKATLNLRWQLQG